MSTDITDPAEPEEEPAGPARRMDPELRQIAAVLRMLEDMDEPARRRVVEYLSARYAK